MREFDKKRKKDVLKIILIIIWMITVFAFSNQKGEESKETSHMVTETVMNTISSKNQEEKILLIEKVEKVIRKFAHYSIYTVGGILIINYAYTKERTPKEKVLYSIAFGSGYAATDELHQLFVSGRSASILDVGIDTLGIITGILIYIGVRYIIKNMFLKDKMVSEV